MGAYPEHPNHRSLDMTRTTALNNGLSYTLIGNVGFDGTPGAKAPTTYR